MRVFNCGCKSFAYYVDKQDDGRFLAVRWWRRLNRIARQEVFDTEEEAVSWCIKKRVDAAKDLERMVEDLKNAE